jgi:hypothetical protein
VPVLSAVVVVIALSIAATLIAGPSRPRITLTTLCLATSLGIAFQRDLPPVARAILTLFGLVALMQAIQIGVSSPTQWTTAKRIWSTFVPFDVRTVRRASWSWDRPMVAKLLLFPWLLLAAIWLPLRFSQNLPPLVARTLGLVCGALFAYVVLDFAAQGLRLIHRLFGLDVGPLQRDPILSRTLAEFWGERWNLPVSRWLNQHFFRPWALQRQPVAGMAFAFVVSAALHFWVFVAAVDWRSGLMAGLFFLLQVPAMVLERRWRVRRWPAPVAHLWTLTFLLLASPLLTYPMIVGLEIQLAGR